MLSLPPSVRIFIAKKPADMRKQFDGLAALVVNAIDEDPQSGHLFVFYNKRRNRLKVPVVGSLRLSLARQAAGARTLQYLRSHRRNAGEFRGELKRIDASPRGH